MKVVCVNVGRDTIYRHHDYTMNLFRALNRHSKRDWKFEVITASLYPGWWAKMEIFPAQERTIYLDLDTVITGNVDFLFDYEGEFCVRRNPWPWNQTGWCDTSLVSVAAGWGERIAEAFRADPAGAIGKYRSDQEFISDLIPSADTWQDFAPGKTASYKADALEAGPTGASIIAFHGRPKPHEFNDGWIRENWQWEKSQ